MGLLDHAQESRDRASKQPPWMSIPSIPSRWRCSPALALSAIRGPCAATSHVSCSRSPAAITRWRAHRSPAIWPPRFCGVMTIVAPPRRRTPAISPAGSCGSIASAYGRLTRRSRRPRATRASRCQAASPQRRQPSRGAWRACRRSTAASRTTAMSRETHSSSPTARRCPSRPQPPVSASSERDGSSKLRGRKDPARHYSSAVARARAADLRSRRRDIEDLGEQGRHRVLRIKGKGQATKVTPVPLNASVSDAVDHAAAGRDNGPLLITGSGARLTRQHAGKLIKRLGEQVGLPHLHPHQLRHAFVTLSLDEDASLRDVQDAARHADPRTTRRYDRNRNSLNRHPTHRLLGALEP